MANPPDTIVIKKILSMSPATGEIKAYSERTVQGKIEVHMKNASVVRFSIGDEYFTASPKDFRGRANGSIFVS